MGFVFVHDGRDDEGALYEEITFSFGRIASGRTRHRDRFDLVLESEIKGGSSQGLSRVRAYVDPFKPPIRKNPARVFLHQPPRTHEVQDLFRAGALLYVSWLEDSDRAWQHWTQRYINYFGPRTDSVANTYFPTAVDQPSTTRHFVDPHRLAS